MGAELVAGLIAPADIAAALGDALKKNARVPFDHLSFAEKDGIVTLSGHVNWKYESVAAATTAAAVPGVKSVDNQIVVEIA